MGSGPRDADHLSGRARRVGERPKVVEDGLDPQLFSDRAHVLHRRVKALLECRVSGFGFRFLNFGFEVTCRVLGFGLPQCRVLGCPNVACWVSGIEIRVSRFCERPEVVEDGLHPQLFPHCAHVLHRRVEALFECCCVAMSDFAFRVLGLEFRVSKSGFRV